MLKYRNKPCVVDGIRFDSKKEAQFYVGLKNSIDVKTVITQPVFILQKSFLHAKTGKKVRAIKYVADFHVFYKNGEEEIIDVKGIKTQVFKIKEKMFLKKFPHLTLKIV